MEPFDLATLKATWSYPTTILFGAGSLEKLPRACAAAGIGRPLVVTDPALAELPPVVEALSSLREAGLEPGLFTELRPNPTADNVEAGLAVLREGGFDGVVAIGGGSALDCGKAIAFMAGQSRPIWDFEDIDDYWKRADEAGILPVVAVPTTAGTGSEVGRAAVISDPASHAKKIIFHPLMLPKTAILDPRVTVGLPPHLTAATGMDALAHSLEAYCAPTFHPMSEGIAVEGMRLVKLALPRAFADGTDLAARGMMLAASSMGAVAFQKGLGAIHALSHPIGALYDTHHGLTNAVLMPYVLAFNYKAIDGKIARLAGWLELPGADFGAFLDWVLNLRKQLGIPHTLRELGVAPEHFAAIAEMAVRDPTAPTNPVPLTAETAEGILREAFEGTGV